MRYVEVGKADGGGEGDDGINQKAALGLLSKL